MPIQALKRGLFDRQLYHASITPLKQARPLVTALSISTISRRRTLAAHTHNEPATVVVSDEDIARLAAEKLHHLTLSDLVRHGRPPLTPSSLYQTANFALSILPARLAHRIAAIRNLPFIVVTNPNVSEIHDNYVHSLSTLLPFASRNIETPEDEERFTEIMAGLVQRHTNTIPILARGFLETRKYLSPNTVTKFLDEHLRARIGTRLIAEQHIALHYSSQTPTSHPTPDFRSSTADHPDPAATYIGIIDTALCPATIIRQCESFVAEICELRYGVRPHITIDGDPETRIAHVPVHLEYILTELLKNAFRAVIEKGTEREPIQITIAPTPRTQTTSTISTATTTTPALTIRIRDRGGGISPSNYANLWTYGFTTFSEHSSSPSSSYSSSSSGMDALSVISGAGAGGSTLAGLGYGLPLGRAYAEYFGGGIELQSLWGWGTDVYLGLRGVGGEVEGVEGEEVGW